LEIIPRRRGSFPGASRASQGAPEKATRTVKILHVKDEAIKLTLEDEGWEAVTCADGAEARRRISGREYYDLLLLDNQLPGASGIEMLCHARSLSHRRRTSVIVLSASEVETEAWRAGADAFLRKPDDMRAIANTVKRLLKGWTG
jgi:DNA-binding response OmpR family regulator